MKTLVAFAFLFVTAAPPCAIGQTTPPTDAAVAQPSLTAEEIKAIKRRLEMIDQEMLKEYYAAQNTRSDLLMPREGGGGSRRERAGDNPLAFQPRRPRDRGSSLPRNMEPVSARHEELIRERAALEAKLAAARIR